jgi:hypothetical protein
VAVRGRNFGYGFEADRDRSACFDGSVSGVSEVVAELARLDGGNETADVSPSVVQDALLRGSHPMLDLGEGLLDRIEVWLVAFPKFESYRYHQSTSS